MSDVPPPRRPAPTPRTYARTHLHRPPPFIERHHPSFTRVHRHPRPSSTSPVAWSCVRFKRPTRAFARALTVHALVCVHTRSDGGGGGGDNNTPVVCVSSTMSHSRAGPTLVVVVVIRSCVVRRASCVDALGRRMSEHWGQTPNVRTLGTDAECPNPRPTRPDI